MSNSNLTGKTALITGCNRGIGKAIVKLFAQNGVAIYACARAETPEFESFIEETARENNVAIQPLYFDLSDEQQIQQALKPLLLNKVKVDILVNNAGIAHGGFLQMTSISKLKEVFEINFFSQMYVTQIISKLMMKYKSGCIVNMASVAGIDAFPGYSAYGSSKAALIYATKTLSKELAKYNIRINAVAPGLADTNMAVEMEDKAKLNLIGASALHRLAKPEEIAEAVLFLVSNESSFITGQVLRVDGGI